MKSPRPFNTPFAPEIGPNIGNGQDNRVYQLVNSAEKPHLRKPTGRVLKINNETTPGSTRVRLEDDREAAWEGVRYKKNKYELMKLFLDDFVPDSSFVLGEVTEGKKKRYAEYTIQDEVPRVSLSDLSEEQKRDPKLINQVTSLASKLKYMYSVLGEVNARTANGVSLDGKLDLGGVSDYVRAEELDHKFDETDASSIINSNSSPNLLVNPESMQLYCIDFDQGQWSDGHDEAKKMAETIVQRDRIAATAGKTAINSDQGQLF